jgi:hypothetical protein
VLPDDSTGQGPGSLAAKLSPVQGGYGALFAVQAQILLSITSVAPKALTDPPPGGERQGYKLSRSQKFVKV